VIYLISDLLLPVVSCFNVDMISMWYDDDNTRCLPRTKELGTNARHNGLSMDLKFKAFKSIHLDLLDLKNLRF